MNSDVEAVYRNNTIVILRHRPDFLPDGSEVPTLRLDTRTTVRTSFLTAIYCDALEACLSLRHGRKYCLEDLLEPELWALMDNHQRRLAGRCFAWLVRKGHLPFEFAPRRQHQTGTFFYYYVGPARAQGGE